MLSLAAIGENISYIIIKESVKNQILSNKINPTENLYSLLGTALYINNYFAVLIHISLKIKNELYYL
ncbi:hypothetical protein CBE01nite_15020 [Clostridium beijerinckii]|uniref:Uncharacterized protein n=1 Tax=Clostridium diolis TaxID=223919 RepID=A0AAV3VAV8_9CLOT|nr:hypothetical protein CDIOL_25490 [Clostridium diolis]GEP63734.1 hypothetical protein CBE01nite_15020 [Clostridium beijerinckii]